MEKKVFNKITKEVFLAYGFKKQGNKYILLLEDICIWVGFYSWRGIKFFEYNFGINNLYDTTTPYDKRYESKTRPRMKHTPSLVGFESEEIKFEEYDEDQYREILTRMLHYNFDPFKENALQYIKDKYWRMDLRKEAKEYLGLKDYITEGYIAKIEWVKPDEGGKKEVEYGILEKYGVQIKLDGPEEVKSLLVGNYYNIEGYKTTSHVYCQKEEKTPDSLKKDLEFTLYEGCKKVADGVIVGRCFF